MCDNARKVRGLIATIYPRCSKFIYGLVTPLVFASENMLSGMSISMKYPGMQGEKDEIHTGSICNNMDDAICSQLERY